MWLLLKLGVMSLQGSLGIGTLELQLGGVEPTWKTATALQWHRIDERARIPLQ
jgi:hypothetical protein